MSEASLNGVIMPLRRDHSTLKVLRVEKTSCRVLGKQSSIVHYFHPFTAMTSEVSNTMRSPDERDQNDASFSTDLRAALAQGPLLLAQPSDAPGSTDGTPADADEPAYSRLPGQKRLSSSTSSSSGTLSPSSWRKSSETTGSKTPKPPSLPMINDDFVSSAEEDGSIAYIHFNEDYSLILLAVVFSRRPIQIRAVCLTPLPILN